MKVLTKAGANVNQALTTDGFTPLLVAIASQNGNVDTQAAYKRAGRPEESLKLLTALAECAQIERRFEAAAKYYRQLSQEHLTVASSVLEKQTAAENNMKTNRIYTTFYCITKWKCRYSESINQSRC